MKKLLLLPIILTSFNLLAQESLEAIQVTGKATGSTLVDFAPAAQTLKGPELNKRRQTSVGDILQQESGITSTSFGPSSSRPVIRGVDGDRVRLLTNGLGTLDASTQSLDHAIPVDPMTINQVEVIRGPMALLYGPTAVGGVVNLHTSRIHKEFEEGLATQAQVQGETVNRGLTSGLALDYGAKNWMLHLDGATRNLADQRIPHYARGGVTQERGKLPNSFNQQDNLAIGASHILSQGHFGFSFNHFNSSYGSVAEPSVKIEMLQNRGEFHFDWAPTEGGLVTKYGLRSAQSDYAHREVEDGTTATFFENEGNETRFEVTTQKGALKGVTGVQTQLYRFSATGDEAFLPTSENTKLGLFTFQRLPLGDRHALSGAARVETVTVEKRSSTTFGAGDERNFLSWNGSVGHELALGKSSTFATTLSYTERAPTFQELYARGDHIATGSYEEGQSTLAKEKVKGVELGWRQESEKTRLVINGYAQFYQDFISLNPTGATGNSANGFGEFRYEQVSALFYGADAEARRQLLTTEKGTLSLVGGADFVRAKDTSTGHNLPRISPPRARVGLELARDRWLTDLEVQYVGQATKLAPNETGTDDYALTNVGATYSILRETSSIEIFGRVRNLFDVVARNHVSLLKEIAPMPGRNLIFGVSARF